MIRNLHGVLADLHRTTVSERLPSHRHRLRAQVYTRRPVPPGDRRFDYVPHVRMVGLPCRWPLRSLYACRRCNAARTLSGSANGVAP